MIPAEGARGEGEAEGPRINAENADQGRKRIEFILPV
jgi:hypothetical protein